MSTNNNKCSSVSVSGIDLLFSKMNGAKPKVKKQNRISRNIHKEITLLRRNKPYASNRSAFLISDSKGKDLKCLNERKYVRFFYKGGSQITDIDIQNFSKFQVTRRTNHFPVILFWFGTCSLTPKNSDGLFVIKEDLDQAVNDTIAEYKAIKKTLLNLNHRAKVLFLECPYFSLSMFNAKRGKKFKNNYFSQQQGKLVNAIDNHNKEIRILNDLNAKAPNFNNDFATRTNRKGRKPRKSVDYSQLRDGCHAGKKIAELWLLRIHRLIYRI